MRGDDGEVVPVPVELARLGPERRMREYLLRGRAGEHRGDDAADVFVAICIRRGRQSRKWGRFVHHPLGSRRLVGEAKRGELRAGVEPRRERRGLERGDRPAFTFTAEALGQRPEERARGFKHPERLLVRPADEDGRSALAGVRTVDLLRARGQRRRARHRVAVHLRPRQLPPPNAIVVDPARPSRVQPSRHVSRPREQPPAARIPRRARHVRDVPGARGARGPLAPAGVRAVDLRVRPQVKRAAV
mmetsp:Transcript_4806/g.21442  ORF Transcript_4806/g.21442 Transcript_4806/m.21442 type:complete len:246 (-) Transcript_4806:301-1038(-)